MEMGQGGQGGVPQAGQPGSYPAQGPPPGGYPPQTYGGGEGGGAGAAAQQVVQRHIRTPETKEFFKTSEFMVWLLTVAGLLIAGLVSENLFSDGVWTLITVISLAYIISRGIAKSGAKRGWDRGGSERGY